MRVPPSHCPILVPDCSPASRTDPVYQHGRQAGVSEGPGQRLEGHHLRSRVHQPGRHLPAHSDGGEWDRVSQRSISISSDDIDLLHCSGFLTHTQFLVLLCVMSFIEIYGTL